jgi:hypothetical protein
MTYRGHIQNGTVVLDEPAALPDGVEVEIVICPEKTVSRDAAPRTLHERLKPFIGIANGLPSDASKNLDHYLYGSPKK